MNTTNGSPGAQLQGSLRTLVIATVFLYVALVGMGVAGFVLINNNQNDTEQLAVQTTAALCALRADLNNRVVQGEQFLEDHPNGFAGFTPEAMQQQIEGQRRTVAALSVLECPPVAEVGQ